MNILGLILRKCLAPLLEPPKTEFPAANIWLRAIAYIMDMILVMLVVGTILSLTYPTEMEQLHA